MKLLVKCTLFVTVEIDDDSDPQFMIEENSCPGTGSVGAAIDAAMEHAKEKSVCWSCNLRGKNQIVEIDGKPV